MMMMMMMKRNETKWYNAKRLTLRSIIAKQRNLKQCRNQGEKKKKSPTTTTTRFI